MMLKPENFEHIIKNKDVAIVGPAYYLMNMNLGKKIDSHDVVVRINRGMESIEKYPEDLGTRSDILYSCLIETSRNAGKLDPKKLYYEKHVKHIVTPPDSGFNGISHRETYHHLVNKKKVEEILKYIPIRLIKSKFHSKFAKEIKCKPNTGILAIHDLLSFNIKSLSIYGFSFYLDGFIPGQKSGVEKENGCTEEEFAEMAFKSKRHIQKNIWEHSKKTLLDNPKVKMDKVLEHILKMEKFDKYLYKGNPI